MSRDRIDWENLPPLPRREQVGATRDDLAARKFNMRKAHHKGRCHITNQKRRQIAKEQASAAKATNQLKIGKFRALKDRIRAYWAGEEEEHP